MSQSAEKTEIFLCTPEEFFSLISDYENYPLFLKEVDRCTIVQKEENRKLVQFDVQFIKTFSYKLWMVESPFKSISWSLDSGDLFKVSNGSWILEPCEGGKSTKATYKVSVEFKLMVPGKVTQSLASVNLPSMMEAYKRVVKEKFLEF